MELKTNHGRRAHEGDIKEMFGLRREQKWPDEGMTFRVIQGVGVLVLSKAEAAEQGVFHRARAHCPGCLRDVGVGRLFQHICKKV